MDKIIWKKSQKITKHWIFRQFLVIFRSKKANFRPFLGFLMLKSAQMMLESMSIYIKRRIFCSWTRIWRQNLPQIFQNWLKIRKIGIFWPFWLTMWGHGQRKMATYHHYFEVPRGFYIYKTGYFFVLNPNFWSKIC